MLPNTYYSPSVETRLLSPQHWAQVRNKGRDTYCVAYHDAIIMRGNKEKYQVTASLNNRKHRNVGFIRSATGIKYYLTTCQAYEQSNETLAFPATISTNNDDVEGTTNDHMPDLDQVREPTNHTGNQVPLLYDEDISVDDEYPTYSQDSQEYMHWHYKLNHCT
jgi:hypothetical protein